jgi:hypothetical protein
VPPKPNQIDRDKLLAALRKLKREDVFYMLVDAIELLPATKLRELAEKHLDVSQLRPDAQQTKTRLLDEVKRFQKASLAGEYYESFSVNSKNCTEESAGTSAWISEYQRLLERCLGATANAEPVEVRGAMDILFALLDHIDEGHDDVIFFADEGGSWQVGVKWETVLPAWFKMLAVTASPEDYAVRIRQMVSNHHSYGGEKMLAIARKIGTPEQRKALG